MQAPDTGDEWLSLTDAALPIGDAYDWVVRDDCGAVVLFSGTTRDHAEGRDGVTSLTYEAYEEQVTEKFAEIVAELVGQKEKEIARALERVDWKNWLGVAPPREYWPGLYHPFQHRGWWDFGTGALGDMACHQLTVPFAACGLRDPVSVVARTTGHDFDSFPASSIIKFEFPETSERPAIPFWWYDRKGNKPPMEVFAEWGIDKVSDSGVLVVGEKAAFYSTDDYCSRYEIKGADKVKADYEPAEDQGKGNDVNNMAEFFRAKREGNPMIAKSNFITRAGPLTETILLGNLAVWAAAEGATPATTPATSAVAIQRRAIADIGLLQGIKRAIRHRRHIGQIGGIGQRIKVQPLMPALNGLPNNCRANKSCATGH